MENAIQPLNEILIQHELKNDDLVKASIEQLTHKQVQKSRKGRCVTSNIQYKVLKALNGCLEEKKYKITDLFNY
ncbi:hypothetical protein MNBD_BACTEROID05-754 [hydrothermal vent metagenome]|uniref:Uncharacterized protein n=1 Tax=hydrothermal vent metagenome TaxID=652676 RepID=A0A3B0TUT1_9ZZZZ